MHYFCAHVNMLIFFEEQYNALLWLEMSEGTCLRDFWLAGFYKMTDEAGGVSIMVLLYNIVVCYLLRREGSKVEITLVCWHLVKFWVSPSFVILTMQTITIFYSIATHQSSWHREVSAIVSCGCNIYFLHEAVREIKEGLGTTLIVRYIELMLLVQKWVWYLKQNCF